MFRGNFSAARALLSLVVCFGMMTNGLAAPAYPIKKSANGRYLSDRNNIPFLMVGDSPHSLIANLDESDAAAYLYNRATNGFNSLWVEALCFPYTGGRSDGSLLDGTLPFTRTLTGGYYDLTAPNSNYFAHVDAILNMAATNHLLVLLDPCETGGWLATMTNNGSNSCWIYGKYLGNRYKNFSNLIWISGNDYDETQWSVRTNDICVTALAHGIASVDTNHAQTVELGADYAFPDSLSDTNWWPMTGLNLVYDYSQTYAGCYRAYSRTNHVPFFNGEQHYEDELNGYPADNVEVGTPLVLRRQEYWTMLSGATGQIYGDKYIWPFSPGWQDNLNTVGVRQLQYNTALFSPRSWWSLVPDTNHTVLTAGYGTYATNGLISTNDYATAARTTNGGLVMVYVPTTRTFTVNMARLSAPAIARWYDPTIGGYALIPGSPFTNSGARSFSPPGANGAGDQDWVLVLETNAPAVATLPAFVQQNHAAAPTAQSQISAAYPATQAVGNANFVVVGWDNPSVSISAITDSAGNQYHASISTFQGNGLSQAIYCDLNIRGGSNTVTVKFTSAAKFASLSVLEYSGLPRTNVFVGGVSTTGRGVTASSGSLVTTNGNELLICAGYATNQFMVAGAGFTQRTFASPGGGLIGDTLAAAPGTYHATATLSSNTWVMQLAAFKGLKPLVPPPITALIHTNNNLVVKFSTVSGQIYDLEATADLAGAWSPVAMGISGTGKVVQITDTNAAKQSARFYRVKVLD